MLACGRTAASRSAHAAHALTGLQNRSLTGIGKLMAANRGEIAVRIMRAGTELDIRTVGIFAHEDRFTQHRYKADESYQVGADKSAVGAYLDIPSIVSTAKEHGVDAIHPGYGFLSEKPEFAAACEANGITFVGPTVENLRLFGDKTSAREVAIAAGVPVVAGTDGPVSTLEEARAFIEGPGGCGYPVMCKAAFGGGGRGMRVVRSADELEVNFTSASNEALNAFGDGTMFIEQFVENPRHIEVQIIGDGQGNVVHLYDRDCSVQRRHQKVVEIAPAFDLPEATREALLADAVKLGESIKYKNAGTVEYLVDEQGRHTFMEVNPRLQVEHTVTEEVTGIDIVQTQLKVAAGMSFSDLGLSQDNISTQGSAMQVRVTTENPALDFQPDFGRIKVWRTPGGMGVRLDDGPGFQGAEITPHYDSLLLKITAHAQTRQQSAAKLRRALREFRVRGVHTNKTFLLNVLGDPAFLEQPVSTGYIAANPQLLHAEDFVNRGQKMLEYIAEVVVNGPDPELGAVGAPPVRVTPAVPVVDAPRSQAGGAAKSLRQTFVDDGPAAFAKAVRDHDGLLIMDTTWRDAHQSHLATRVRTRDMLAVAEPTANMLKPGAYSMENWGGATFDVAYRFLRECPWDRLAEMREAVPDIPFQMLLRGANAVGYTSYPDNVVFDFCRLAKDAGMDVFRIFDSLNYLENMKLGIDAVGQAGGIVEACVCYTGDVLSPRDGRYNLDYYLEYTRALVAQGIHVLAIKDMAGLLKPEAARVLVGAIRAEFPDLPIHVHTHDTAGTGVASMIECARAGADAVDVAIDSMSGMTSQPSMGALVASLQGTDLDTNIDLDELVKVNDYWEQARGMYAPFETGAKSGSSDVVINEIPGGQYTNMAAQAYQLGLADQWPAVKQAYAAANRLLGDITKVTPSSKVVGDLAQYMVANGLTEEDVLRDAETLSFPMSVVDYFQGSLGIPPYGFPEELRAKVLKHAEPLANGNVTYSGRPGAEMEDYDFERAAAELREKYGPGVREVDVMSHALYPAVYDKFQEFGAKYWVRDLDTPTFLAGLEVGQEIEVNIEQGKTLFIRLLAVGNADINGFRDVMFDLNGAQRTVRVQDKAAGVTKIERRKADVAAGSVGAPMPGSVVEVRVAEGDHVEVGDPLLVLSAMKMETVVAAPASGVVVNIEAVVGDSLAAGDLVVEIDEGS